MTDFDPDDIAALHHEGDLGRLLRDEIAKGRARREKPALKPQAPAPPGRRPGQWPPGTRPPDPPPPIPAAEIDRALAESRDWLAAGQPHITAHCECEPCQQLA